MADNTPKLTAPFAGLGRALLDLVSEMGAMAIFLGKGLAGAVSSFSQIPKAWREIYRIGVKSLSVIVLIGLFTGMVIGLQTYYALSKFGSEGFLGAAVALSIVKELGPVLTAIMVTGRAGSSMAAEIGVMRISDQIDALEVMGISPMRHLVSPKLAASLAAFPILTAVFDLVGIAGGYLTGVALLGGNAGVYWHRVHSSLGMDEIGEGFTKALVFAVVVCTVCCFKGYFTHMRSDGAGPEGVSNSTTSAVVLSCVLILMSDYLLTSILF